MKCALVLALAAALSYAQAPSKVAKKPSPVKAEPAQAETSRGTIMPGEPTPGGFIGNKGSKAFHKPDCKTAAKTRAANKVTFGSKAEARKAGYKACKICKP